MRSLTWLERIISALDFLGGEGHLEEIYSAIEQKWPEALTKSWKATVRKEIETHCKSSANFRGDEAFIWIAAGRYQLKENSFDVARNHFSFAAANIAPILRDNVGARS